MKSLELRIPPVVQVAILAIAMYGLSEALPELRFSLPGSFGLSVFFGVTGGFIALLGVMAFRDAQTTVDPRAPQDTASLVVRGVYRYSRNPMYLGFLFLLLSWTIYLSHAFAFILLPLFVGYMNRFQIQPEETFMREKFGEDYLRYQKRVRRWV